MRNKEVLLLKQLFHSNVTFPKWVHVFGMSSCGKTTTIKSFFKANDVRHIYIDCVEYCDDEKRLFSLILNDLCRKLDLKNCPIINKDINLKTACQNVNNFVNFLSVVFSASSTLFVGKLVVILDNVERLRRSKSNILQILLNLDNFVNTSPPVPITILTICKLPHWQLICKSGFDGLRPMEIYFSNFSQDQLSQILCQNFEECEQNFHVKTLNLRNMCLRYILEVFPKNLFKLKYIVEKRLYPFLLNINQKLLLNDENSNDSRPAAATSSFDECNAFKAFRSLIHVDNSNNNHRFTTPISIDNHQNSNNKSHDNLECNQLCKLPPVAKFLLLASYIASYNPPTSDARYFLKKCEKRRSNARLSKISDFKTQFYQGPKIFTLERLLVIFIKISESKLQFSNEILSQISTLCKLKMLQKCSNDKLLDVIKYKCLCSFQLINKIAESIDFDIKHYFHNYR